MPLLNYTTTITPQKTVMEIQSALAKIGANRILTDMDDKGNVVALSFQLSNPETATPIAFRLPTDWKPVHETLKRQRVASRLQTPEQALRVAWRITKDWIEAQAAIIETKMVTPAQVFLPYAMTRDGQTMYEYIASNQHLLGSGE